MTGELQADRALDLRGTESLCVRESADHPTDRALDRPPIAETGAGGAGSTAERRLEMEIARRAATEHALHGSEQRLRLALEATGLGTWDWNPLTGELFWDERTYEMWGVEPGRTADYALVQRGIHPDDRACFEAAVGEALDPVHGGSFHSHYRVVGVDRPVDRCVEAQGRASFEDGRAVRLIGTVLDVTERRRADEALAESERQLCIALETAALGTWSRNVETGESRWDARRRALLGASPDEPVDFEAFLARVHPEDRARVRETAQRAVLPGGGGRYCAVFRVAGRPERWLESHSLVVEAPGRAKRLVGTLRDVSEHRRVEQEQQRLIEEAQEAVRARDEFLAIAVHELRTPLTALGLQVDRLVRGAGHKPGASEVVKDPILNVKKQVQRLARLVDGLFDAARISAGRLSLDLEELDLSALVRETVDRLRPDDAVAGCALELHAPEPVLGAWDPLRIGQVVMNLVANAVRYGAGKPVDVSLESTADGAVLRVRDRGIGVAPQDQARIFGRFERAVSLHHRGGLGLGLYIARQIVDAHGGSITVESGLGEGATFTVVLPRP